MEFLEKLQRVCGQIPEGTGVRPVLSSPSPARLAVGNWSLACQREGEVSIHNADGTRVGGASTCRCNGKVIVCARGDNTVS